MKEANIEADIICNFYARVNNDSNALQIILIL